MVDSDRHFIHTEYDGTKNYALTLKASDSSGVFEYFSSTRANSSTWKLSKEGSSIFSALASESLGTGPEKQKQRASLH